MRIGVPLGLAEDRPAAAERDRPGGRCGSSTAAGLSRGKGAGDLAEACLRLPSEDWELTMVGPDTETTTFKQSMRDSIEEMFGGDPRVRFEDVPSGDCELIAEHDLLVAPSRFDVWPVEVLEAMAAGPPGPRDPGRRPDRDRRGRA